MKVHDKVTIKDGSYMVTTINNNLSHTRKQTPYFPGLITTECEVIITNIIVPLESQKEKSIIGNTIIKDDCGNYWFCNAKVNLNKV